MFDPGTQRRQGARNLALRTLLLGCLLGLAAGVALLLLAALGLLWTLVLGGVVLALGMRIPRSAVKSLFRQPLPGNVAAELNGAVEQLAARAHMHHPPALCYLPSPVPNIFCAGHGRGAVLAI